MEVEEPRNIITPFKQLASPGHVRKVNRSLPGNKLQYQGKNSQPLDQLKNKNISKLPRSGTTSTSKPIKKLKNDAGDNIAGNSKSKNPELQCKKITTPVKIKSSCIPRRIDAKAKITPKTEIIKDSTEHQLFSETRNIQRVQLLINSDFYQDDRNETTSVMSARPIPKLEQINGNNYMIDSDRSNDWFTRLSLDAPSNSSESNRQTGLNRQTLNDNNENIQGVAHFEIACSCTQKPTVIINNTNSTQNTSNITNQNISDWLTSERENTNETEFGHRISSLQTQDTIDIRVVNSNQSYNQSAEGVNDIERLIKLNEDSAESFKDEYKTYESSFKENSDIADVISNEDVSSYVEWPSEELERTTNLEGDDCESQKSVSNIVGTDLEIMDDVSCQYAIEPIDSCRTTDDPVNIKWSPVRNLSNNGTLVEETTLSKFWLGNYRKKEGDDYKQRRSCWRKDNFRFRYQYSKSKGRGKRYQQYKILPSNRYRLSKKLDSLKKRLTIRICRRRWNHVWKKTAERWALWSKSPSKFKKIRIMHYLQRSILWEDVDVQTTILVYRETGTDSVLKEQKSTAIATLLKLTSNSQADTNEIDAAKTSPNLINKSRINQGPSRFPFLYYSERRSLQLDKSKITTDRAPMYSSSHEKYKSNTNYIHESDKPDKNNDSRDIGSVCMDKDTSKEFSINMEVTSGSFNLEPVNQANATMNDTYTQMTIGNDAATDTTFVSTFATWDGNSIDTATSTSDITFYRPCGINTESTYLNTNKSEALYSVRVMTSREIVTRSLNAETQVTPKTFIKISRGITTVTPKCEKKTSVDDIGIDILGSSPGTQKNYSSAQTQPQEPMFICTRPALLSISSVVMKSTSAVTSRQCITNCEVTTDEVAYKDSECLTTSSLQRCKSYHLNVMSNENEVKDINTSCYGGTSTNDLDTYCAKARNFAEVTHARNLQMASYVIFSAIDNDTVCTEKNKENEQRPTYYSVTTNTDDEKPQMRSSEVSTLTNTNTNYSFDMNNNVESEIESSKKFDAYLLRSACIGPNSLLSVCTINESFKDIATQTRRIRHEAATFLDIPLQSNCQSATAKDAATGMQTIHSPVTISTKTATKEVGPIITCACANFNSGHETSTDHFLNNDLECPTQTPSVLHQRHAEIKMSGCSIAYSKEETPKINKLINDQITSLSRLIGQRSSNSEIPPNYEASRVLSNGMDADKWTKTFTTTAEDSLANDSLSDILPMHRPSRRTSDSQVLIKSKAITNDQVTLDKTVKKDFKEFKLQANPEICNAATEYMSQEMHRSASVFTSRCYLPYPSPCVADECLRNQFSNCYYVYGKPRCLMHNEKSNVAVQINLCQINKGFTQEEKNQITSHSTSPICSYTNAVLGEIISPKAYKALYETVKLVFKDDYSKSPLQKHITRTSCDSVSDHKPSEPNIRSTNVVLSKVTNKQTFVDHSTQPDNDYKWLDRGPVIDGLTQTCSNCRVTYANLSPDGPKCLEEYIVKSHLVTTCRYYSQLLTKHFGRVRENFIKHLTTSSDPYQNEIPNPMFIEATTMKPSGRQDLCCQTNRIYNCYMKKPMSCILTRNSSLTDLCQYDKDHLKSIYNMLTAIEGRIRRLKANLSS